LFAAAGIILFVIAAVIFFQTDGDLESPGLRRPEILVAAVTVTVFAIAGLGLYFG